VVQWTTIQLMLILEVLLGLMSKLDDITNAFVHADVEDGENIYVEMPHGFKRKGKVLKLKKTLWVAPMPKSLNLCGMEQSIFNPCLFIGEKVMCICYVDDLIFWSLNEADIKNWEID
jgi:hypothetical protein